MSFLGKYKEYLGVDPLRFATWISEIEGRNSKKVYHIELRAAGLTESFRKKYHCDVRDYCNLFIDRNRVSDTLYRYGGLTDIEAMNKHKYVQILKYTPAKYTKEEKEQHKKWGLKNQGDYYLKETWVIIDTDSGEEMMNFERFNAPMVQDFIAFRDGTYYYIPTGEMILSNAGGATIETDTYIIVPLRFQKSAVMINKTTGEKTEIN